jgi:regulator of PEP synthase PpsR (kinase-PPPase family)
VLAAFLSFVGVKARMSTIRPVFYVSDGTGITAETIGHSLLTQFSGFSFITDRMSFVDDPEKAREACARIQAAGSGTRSGRSW